MSLEQALQDNTNALKELIQALKLASITSITIPATNSAEILQVGNQSITKVEPTTLPTITPADTPKAAEPEVPTPAATETVAAPTPSTAPVAEVAAPETKPAPSTPTTSVVSQEDFVRVMRSYGDTLTDKSPLVAMLQKSGVKKFSEVPSDKFAELLERVPAELVANVLKKG